MMKPSDISRSDRIERAPLPEQPSRQIAVDRDLTVYRDGVSWKFAGGKVLVNGQDINRMIAQDQTDIGFWIGLADGLNEYRKRLSRAARERDQFAKFEAVVEALLGKILGRLKKAYDQKMSGLSWSLENGQLILNGINIRSFLALYRLRKTEKARRFLKGLRSKLALLLENPDESPDYERIHGFVEALFREIGEELDAANTETAPRASRSLLPGRT